MLQHGGWAKVAFPAVEGAHGAAFEYVVFYDIVIAEVELKAVAGHIIANIVFKGNEACALIRIKPGTPVGFGIYIVYQVAAYISALLNA